MDAFIRLRLTTVGMHLAREPNEISVRSADSLLRTDQMPEDQIPNLAPSDPPNPT